MYKPAMAGTGHKEKSNILSPENRPPGFKELKKVLMMKKYVLGCNLSVHPTKVAARTYFFNH